MFISTFSLPTLALTVEEQRNAEWSKWLKKLRSRQSSVCTLPCLEEFSFGYLWCIVKQHFVIQFGYFQCKTGWETFNYSTAWTATQGRQAETCCGGLRCTIRWYQGGQGKYICAQTELVNEVFETLHLKKALMANKIYNSLHLLMVMRYSLYCRYLNQAWTPDNFVHRQQEKL